MFSGGIPEGHVDLLDGLNEGGYWWLALCCLGARARARSRMRGLMSRLPLAVYAF